MTADLSDGVRTRRVNRDQPRDRPVEPGVWRYGRASRARLVIDGADYFRLLHEAMRRVNRQITMIGWDFDTRVELLRGARERRDERPGGPPSRLGRFLPWLVRRRASLSIHILKWGLGLFQLLTRGSMLVDLLRMAMHPRISFKFDNHHPVGCSHHMKLAVIDRRLAVCGGIDITAGRWDTREHRVDDPRRGLADGKPAPPWHDLALIMEGEIARTLGELADQRWRNAGGEPIAAIDDSSPSPWPDSLLADFTDVEIGIARTRAAYGNLEEVREIEALYLAQIASARRFIYIENQYFTSRRLAEALLRRLEEDDPPEIVIVHPRHAEGWLEQQAMDHGRDALARILLAADRRNRFALFCPMQGETDIYVHAKLMIVDDRILRVGSANLNNRSMGLDSECDVFIDCAREGNEHCREPIRRIRCSLLAEHCGAELEEVMALARQEMPMAQIVARLGDRKGRWLDRYRPPDITMAKDLVAGSELFDPEHSDEIFEPFAKHGLFRKGNRLARWRERLKREEKAGR